MMKMMKKMKSLKMMMIGAALASVAACTVAPTADVLASADYGTYPDNYLDVITAYHENVLKDPSSAQVKVLIAPRKSWTVSQYSKVFGYRTCLTVNAKNSYGGYTGTKLTSVFIRDGRVIRYDQPHFDTDGSVSHACKVLAQGDTQ